MIIYLFALTLSSFSYGQFNLYHTEPAPTQGVPFFFDCLYYSVVEDTELLVTQGKRFEPTHQIIPYCVRPENIDAATNNEPGIGKPLTFELLKSEGVSIYDLLTWSISIDLIEQFQDFLNNSTHVSPLEVFYNCTPPWFGPSCQYTFQTNVHSFSSIVQTTYRVKNIPSLYEIPPIQFNNLTCYMHLRCRRGSLPFCLDWREICDGQVDCLDDGVDEMHCLQLEMNQCGDDEFQCHNGMCVPAAFFDDSPYNFDCLDGSDEFIHQQENADNKGHSHCSQDPSFRCEELSSVFRTSAHFFCGDGETCTLHSKRCCKNGRSVMLHNSIFAHAANNDLTYELR